MDHTVYFADKAVVFTTQAPCGEWYAVAVADDGGVSRAKITKILETQNRVAVISADPDATFAAFSAEFTPVEAAGGLVVDAQGAWLMIYRNGRWDLPKGHIERGETPDQAAVREIAEETGIAARVVRPLCRTWHAYYFEKTARWELKRTHWFELEESLPSQEDTQPSGTSSPTMLPWDALPPPTHGALHPPEAHTPLALRQTIPIPQTEEGIERAGWCAPGQVVRNLQGAFPTIRCVAEAMEAH